MAFQGHVAFAFRDKHKTQALMLLEGELAGPYRKHWLEADEMISSEGPAIFELPSKEAHPTESEPHSTPPKTPSDSVSSESILVSDEPVDSAAILQRLRKVVQP